MMRTAKGFDSLLQRKIWIKISFLSNPRYFQGLRALRFGLQKEVIAVSNSQRITPTTSPFKINEISHFQTHCKVESKEGNEKEEVVTKPIHLMDLKTFPDLMRFFKQFPSVKEGWNFLSEEERKQLKEKIATFDHMILSSSVQTYCDFFSLCGALPILWDSIPEHTQKNITSDLTKFDKDIQSFALLEDWLRLMEGIHDITVRESKNKLVFFDCQSRGCFGKLFKYVFNKIQFSAVDANLQPGIIFELLLPLHHLYFPVGQFSLNEGVYLLRGIELHLMALPADRTIPVLRSLRVSKLVYSEFEKASWDRIMDGMFDKIASTANPQIIYRLLEELAELYYCWFNMPSKLRNQALQCLVSLFSPQKKDVVSSLIPSIHTERIKTLGKLYLPWSDLPLDLQNNLDQSFQEIIQDNDYQLRVELSEGLKGMGLQWNHVQFPPKTKYTLQMEFFQILKSKEEVKRLRDYVSYLSVFRILEFDWTKDAKVKAVILDYLNNITKEDDPKMKLLSSIFQIFKDLNISFNELPSSFQRYVTELRAFRQGLFDGIMWFKEFPFEKTISLLLKYLKQNKADQFLYILPRISQAFVWDQFTKDQRHELASIISQKLLRIQKGANISPIPVWQSFPRIIEAITLLTFDSISISSFNQLSADEKDRITQDFIALHQPLVEFYFSSKELGLFSDIKLAENRKLAIYFDWLRVLPEALQRSLLYNTAQTEFPQIQLYDYTRQPRIPQLTLLKSELVDALTNILKQEMVKKEEMEIAHEGSEPEAKEKSEEGEVKQETLLQSSLSKKSEIKIGCYSIIPNYNGLTSNTFPMTFAIKREKNELVFLELVEYEKEREGIPKREYLLKEYLYNIYFPKIPGIRFSLEDLKSPVIREELIHQVKQIVSSHPLLQM